MITKYYKILSKEEELELFKRYHDGDVEAFNELVIGNQLNIINIAREVSNRNKSVQYDDLVSEGNIVLIRCIELFNPEYGFRLWAYSKRSIYAGLHVYLTKDRTIKIPRRKLEELGGERTLELDGDDLSVDFDTADLSDFKLKDDMEVLDFLIDGLDEEEMYIITHYYGIYDAPKMKMFEIAKELGLLKGKCSKIHSRIIRDLKEKTIFL